MVAARMGTRSVSVHVCIFESAGHLAGRKRTYEAVKAAVLAAGRFSVFEATSDIRTARMFTRLCKDPELETITLAFPWTGVRRRRTLIVDSRGVPMRYDEIDWYERISDGKTVLWMCGAGTYVYHGTVDGKVAVCSSSIGVDRDRDPYPNTVDRSRDTMTCDRCAEFVRRIPMPPPRTLP